jgi:ribonuclease HI
MDGYTLACFDGASISGGGICGAGGVIKQPDSTVHRWFLNCGNGTNTKAELMGVWATLYLAKQWNIQKIQILGDSKVVIDWLNHRGKLQAIDIEGWKLRTKELASNFLGINFQHIFREFNKEADDLSKQALLAPKGRLSFFAWDNGTTGPTSNINLFYASWSFVFFFFFNDFSTFR